MKITRLLNYSFMYFMAEEMSVDVKKQALSPIDNKQNNRFKIPHKNIVVTKTIDIFANDELVDSADYKIYPLLGEALFHEEVDEDLLISASYSYSVVNVVGYTNDDIIEPPLLAIENSGDNDYGYELGSLLSEVEALFFIHIYAVTPSQRDDLCDMLKKALRKRLLIYDYSQGFPLLMDGSINSTEIPVINSADFTRVSVKKNPLEESDDIERGRALISVICKYVD